MARSDGSQRGELMYFKGKLETYSLTSEDREDLIELLGTLSRNGFHPHEFGTGLPTPSVQAAPVVYRGAPKTLLEASSLGSVIDKSHLEKVVGQLLAFGYVASAQCQILLRRLSELAQASDTLRQELLRIPSDRLRRADEAIGEKT